MWANAKLSICGHQKLPFVTELSTTVMLSVEKLGCTKAKENKPFTFSSLPLPPSAQTTLITDS
jgi:hypothetical protein